MADVVDRTGARIETDDVLADVSMRSHRRPALRRFLRTPTAVIGLLLFLLCVVVALFADVIAPGPAYERTNPLLTAPSDAHRFGTDHFQRDLFYLVVHGIRISMTVVAWVVAISGLVGVLLGLVAGYMGSWVEDAIIKVAELVQSVPRFFLALLVLAIYGQGMSKIILVLAPTSWPLLARVVRAETISIKRRPFVEASRASGASGRWIVLRHVLPNILPAAVVILVLMGSRVILIEAGLAYLGLGDALQPSLGTLARNAQDFLRDSWWMSVFPGGAIVLCVLAMNLLSDGLARSISSTSAPRGEALRRAT